MDFTLNLPFFEEYASNVDFSLLQPPGKEHYRLLAYLSTLFNNVNIFDIGTHTGGSAYALAYNVNNNVYTFDIVNNVSNMSISSRTNIKFNFCDLFNESSRQPWTELLLGSPLIFLDVDPHNGQMEIDFYHFLVNNDYQGILICDDVWYFKEMRDVFWSQIPVQNRYDLTQYGHWSGTSAIVFSEKHKNLFPKQIAVDDWTIVTAYYNPSKYHTSKPKSHYLENACATLSVPHNLVVYCEPADLEQIKQLRPTHLSDKTQYIALDADNLFLTKNGPSNYRYSLMMRTLDHNPFNSKYFAWMNICIEHQGFKNLLHLEEALAIHRNKFSILIDTQYTEYSPEISVYSGFFTANIDHMQQICRLILNDLSENPTLTEKQIYCKICAEYPQLFEYYYGTQSDPMTNYIYAYNVPSNLLQYIIDTYNHNQYNACLDCCKFIWQSYTNHKCLLSPEQIKQVLFYKYHSKISIQPNSQKSCVYEQCIPHSTIISCLYETDLPQLEDKYPLIMQKLSELTFPVIIWTSSSYYNKLQSCCHGKNNIIINQRELDQFNQYKKSGSVLVHCRSLPTNNILTYSHPSLWAESIELNPFHTKTFICININTHLLSQNINTIEQWHIPDRVKLMIIEPYTDKDPEPAQYFTQSRSNVSCQLITGNAQCLTKYTQLFNREFLTMISNHSCLSNIELTAILIRKHPELFDCYYGNECTILTNYEKLRANVDYFGIFSKYLNSNMYTLAQSLVDKIDYNYNNELRFIFVHFSILTNYYTMNQMLNPIAIQILNDPRYLHLKQEIFKMDGENLGFYQNKNEIL
jgi:hypothetical protein